MEKKASVEVTREKSRRKMPARIDNGRFEVIKKVGAGCFGEVYKGFDTTTQTEVAIKFEDGNSTAPQLDHENQTLSILKQPSLPQGFVECFFYGQEGVPSTPLNCLVMEFLGNSLEDRVEKCHGHFSVKTATLIAEQVLYRIEYLHSKGIVHRDIKPENFMFGIKGKVHHLYLIDFGLSKKYWDRRHIPPRQKLSLTGTARYASINAHRGCEQGRRDDLEAIGHMLIYFLRGSLPWSGLEAKTKQEKFNKIKEKKERVPLEELCSGYPDAFMRNLQIARNLEFTARPDYDGLQRLFRGVRDSQGPWEDHEFQWFENQDASFAKNLVPLIPRVRLAQPDDDKRQVNARRSTSLFCCGGKSPVRD